MSARPKTSKRTPLKRRIEHWLALKVGVPVAYAGLRLLHRTWKIERLGEDSSRIRPGIFAIWHGDLLVGAQELPYLLPTVDVLASRSRDGELVAHYVHLFGARTIRGGSSKGGADALRQMRHSIMRERSVVIPVDGPRGPFGEVKIGVAALAAQTGAPIIPGAVQAERGWRFKSWDRAFVPKPFSKVRLYYGNPIRVEPHATREQIEAARQELERVLYAMHEEISYK